VKLYTEMDVRQDKLVFQIPATWEGIMAVEQLEKKGISTIVESVFRYVFSNTRHSVCLSFCQAVAAAQVDASVVLINIGRVEDWYNSHPGVIRDPTVLRRDRSAF